MSEYCITCTANKSGQFRSESKLKAKINFAYGPSSKLSSVGNIKPINSVFAGITSKFSTVGEFKGSYKLMHGPSLVQNQLTADIFVRLQSSNNVRSKFSALSVVKDIKADKFGGNTDRIKNINFHSNEKLFPVRDIVTNYNNSYFVNESLQSSGLFESVNYGVATNGYVYNGGNGKIVSNEELSYIQPSSIYTSGNFRYKFEVSAPFYTPQESFLFIRAAAPTSTISSNIPPEYRISNIRFEDPSGNLIIKYKDIILRGDSDYSKTKLNFVTYISEPEVNNLKLYSWEKDYPILGQASGYTLNLDFSIQCLDDPFSIGFNKGYEDACKTEFIETSENSYLSFDGSPLSTQTQSFSLNPTNSLRISDIEIANSGVRGFTRNNLLNFYVEVNSIGNRLTRTISPVDVILSSQNLDIYPTGYSTWISSPDTFGNTYTNETIQGSKVLANQISNDEEYDFITLLSSDPHQDSGRLTLKFAHQDPGTVAAYSDGEFKFGDFSFDRALFSNVAQIDNFFVIDEIELKIIAKKALGSRNYSLDIVGYSDDGLLNITPKIGAFLQNLDTGSGVIPSVSGFRGIDDLGLSSESMSDKDQFYISPLVDVEAGDHYKLSLSPVINTTSFQEYTIPLKVYKNDVLLGAAKDYSSSSYFENLYFDIYPIPSGASIASAKLVVKYKPSNALSIHTVAHAADNESIIRDMKLFPTLPKNNNDLSNLVGTSGSYSIVNNIPQAFTNDTTLKTNYARRWRAIDGNVVDGPFNQNQFAFFDYQNDQRLNPFLNGYFTFSNDSGNLILSDNIGSSVPISGLLVGSYNKVSNIGSRFNNNSLFNHATNYTTIDWTTPGHELHGKIADSYDNAIRLSGVNSYINFGNLDTIGGFGLYVRFSPDKSISGINYNGFDSGIIASKWNNGNSPEFILGYEDGHLYAKALDNSGNYIHIVDTAHYSAYQYPLSVVLTYNDDFSKKLKLYTSNELNYLSENLRNSSNEFNISSGISDLTIGYSKGSGIGINIFLTECGISTYNERGCNITESGVDKLYKQTTVTSWLNSHGVAFESSHLNSKHCLSNYVDDDTLLWHLGEFKSCFFSPDFDFFTKRIGQDFIVHKINSDGIAYINKTNTGLPSNIYASGLSYHTQIENDFIRFNIADIPDNDDTSRFYSSIPRINKSFPRGYSVADKALVIDAIIEHETDNLIYWNDGKIGPKLILSLYTKNKESGLINRSIHYLEPSGCLHKIYGNFTLDSLFDISEPWAMFDLDDRLTEFDHKFFANDLNDAFIQIDLAYPSGSPFNSLIKIHSMNLRLEDAVLNKANKNNSFNLYNSGEKIWLDQLNLITRGQDVLSTTNNLFVLASNVPSASSIMNMFTSVDWTNDKLGLFLMNSGVSVSSTDLYINGKTNKFTEDSLILVHSNNIFNHFYFNAVNLYSRATVENLKFENTFSMYVDARLPFVDNKINNLVNFYLQTDDRILRSKSERTNLYINTNDPREFSSGNINLYTINYPAFGESFGQYGYIVWNGSNIGKNINVDDNIYSSLAANDEIRGVELICYGECSNSGTCSEPIVDLHDTEWFSSACINGGIFRPERTYTNLATSGFNSPVGYSGHFYGIRKYDGLTPNTKYSVTMAGRTGNNKSVVLSRVIEDVEYGLFEDATYSGVKILSDQRQVNDRFGKSVAVSKDFMVIGAPNHSLNYQYIDSNGNPVIENIENAGAIFVYNRGTNPSGSNWSESKSDWSFGSKITLPSSIVLEHYNTRQRSFGPFKINERLWETGQRKRNLGSSLDLAQSGDRSILVAGGTNAAFKIPDLISDNQIQPSSVSVGLLLFSDEFEPEYNFKMYDGEPFVIGERQVTPTKIVTIGAKEVFDSVTDRDLLFRYFSSPPVKFDIKIMICEPLSEFTTKKQNSNNLLYPNVYKKTISRAQGTNSNETIIANQIKDIFHEAFPYDSGKLNNNIPAMLGIVIDNSRSLRRQAISDGLDSFIKYYKDYSLASGLKDFYNTPTQGAVYETISNNEIWIYQATELLKSLLDINRLIKDNQVKVFTSGIGESFFNPNLSEFNHVPESGGRVYIFEKEGSDWNLIQEIRSPNNYNNDICDRYGHSVSISKNAEVIAVGSPYINQACQVYEYKPQEKQRLLSSISSWVSYKNSSLGGASVRYIGLINSYALWSAQYGTDKANDILYSYLNGDEKFQARKYLNIEEYQKIFTYSYSDIQMVGNNWIWIPETFVPSSRLGYSSAVNEDGSIVAFGAPTDSMNRWEDGNIYYKNRGYQTRDGVIDTENLNSFNQLIPSWASNVNAGAVRLFDSRKIYPHDKVVEFTKFGNLHRSLNDPLDSGHFNYISTVFGSKGFKQTEFTDVSIPQDAGLAFIITPEVDALSDEVANNIMNWLALGDRNLVLVGNDPVWESSGIYSKSNEIINKILSKLGSRVRLQAARNEREALISVSGTAMASYIPIKSTKSNISTETLPAYGVADIRFYDLSFPILNSSSCDKPLEGELIDDEFKPKCSLPLSHNGDLRAEFFEPCMDCKGQIIEYPVNIAYMFKTFEPKCCTDPSDFYAADLRKNLSSQEPIPVLVAAALNTAETIIPAVPPVSGVRKVGVKTIINTFPGSKILDKSYVPSGLPDFIVDTQTINNVEFNTDNFGSWYEPQAFLERRSILQSNAIPQNNDIINKLLIQNITVYAAEEKYENNSSIFVIAGNFTEDKDMLYKYNQNFFDLTRPPQYSSNPDKNINFYTNIVYNKFGSNIAQLGGWTGRNSFESAYPNSALYEVFLNNGNNVDINVLSPSVTHDVCWIANPANVPSDEDILKLKIWLGLGNRKLVITMGGDHDYDTERPLDIKAKLTSSADIVKNILNKLNSKITPLYLDKYEQYDIAGIQFDIFNPDEQRDKELIYTSILLNPDHPVSKGQNVNTSISNISIDPIWDKNKFFVGLSSKNITPVALLNRGPVDIKIENLQNTSWMLDTGISEINIPVIPGSGYRLFITNVSEHPSENQPINILGANFAIDRITPDHVSGFTLGPEALIYDRIIKNITYSSSLPQSTTGKPSTRSLDIYVPKDVSGIKFYLYNKSDTGLSNIDYIPKTTRLLAVSGSLIPFSIVTSGEQLEIFEYEPYLISSGTPSAREISTFYGPIVSDATKYTCCLAGSIADGPVITAQESEHFSEFLNGTKRSTITIIADSSLVQGRYAGDEARRASASTVNFINSLYPKVNFDNVNRGRQFVVSHKIIAPDRGSAAKYKSINNNNNGLSIRFGGSSGHTNMSAFSDKDSKYDPKFVRSPQYEPWIDPDFPEKPIPAKKIKEVKEEAINAFANLHNTYGSTSMFSGVLNNKVYVDAGFAGGIPEIMRDTGYDYLDFDEYPSGYPGDLFGYSIALSKNRLIVGSPFHAFVDENIKTWSEYIENNGSGTLLSYNGGAGSVYVFEKTFKGSGVSNTVDPWECVQKLRPATINVDSSGINDQFGYDVDIDSDTIIVGAPGHDFGNLVIDGSGAFVRKFFNAEFNIRSRVVINVSNSGNYIKDQGAAFVYENRIQDWSTKKLAFGLVEKISSQSNQSSGNHFGESISIYRSNRTDSDYTVSVGSSLDSYDNSGQLTINAGSAYSYDIMLREQPPSIPNSGTWIYASIFGDTDENNSPKVNLFFYNSGENVFYGASGYVYTNNQGEIYLEASGQDLSDRGFMQQRPFIESVDGQIVYGTQTSGFLPLFIDGERFVSSNMNISYNVEDKANVYNSLGLYNGAVQDIITATPSGINLYSHAPDPIVVSSSGLNMIVSGVGISVNNMNVYIRGI